MKKKILSLGIIVLLLGLMLALTGCGEKSENETTKNEISTSTEESSTNNENAKSSNNNNGNVRFENKDFEGLELSGMQLVKDDDSTAYNLLGTITNTSSSTTPSQVLKITFIDKDGKELGTINNLNVKELQPNDSYYVNMMAKMNLAGTYDYKITK